MSSPNIARTTPKWKTAVVVWLSIYPLITFLSWALWPLVESWPLALRTLVLTLIAVPLMVAVLIPWWSKVLRPWLTR